MPTVRVPTELFAALVPLLALRGVRTLHDGPADVVVAPDPTPGARWLALVDDAAAVVAALDNGADDAVEQGATPPVIAARAARLLRGGELRCGGMRLDPVARRARVGDRALDLFPREFAVLLYLARHCGRPVGRAELNAAIWGRRFDPGTNVIEVHVSRIRRALGHDAGVRLWTDRGRGYRLAVDSAVAPRVAAS